MRADRLADRAFACGEFHCPRRIFVFLCRALVPARPSVDLGKIFGSLFIEGRETREIVVKDMRCLMQEGAFVGCFKEADETAAFLQHGELSLNLSSGFLVSCEDFRILRIENYETRIAIIGEGDAFDAMLGEVLRNTRLRAFQRIAADIEKCAVVAHTFFFAGKLPDFFHDFEVQIASGFSRQSLVHAFFPALDLAPAFRNLAQSLLHRRRLLFEIGVFFQEVLVIGNLHFEKRPVFAAITFGKGTLFCKIQPMRMSGTAIARANVIEGECVKFFRRAMPRLLIVSFPVGVLDTGEHFAYTDGIRKSFATVDRFYPCFVGDFLFLFPFNNHII